MVVTPSCNLYSCSLLPLPCTCRSIKPGHTTKPLALITSFPFNGSDEICATRLFMMPTFLIVSILVSGSITRPAVNTISYSMDDCACTDADKEDRMIKTVKLLLSSLQFILVIVIFKNPSRLKYFSFTAKQQW